MVKCDAQNYLLIDNNDGDNNQTFDRKEDCLARVEEIIEEDEDNEDGLSIYSGIGIKKLNLKKAGYELIGADEDNED